MINHVLCTRLVREVVNQMSMMKLHANSLTQTHTHTHISMFSSQGLARLEELVRKVVDLVDNRVTMNLNAVANTILVDLPSDRSFSYDDFISTQFKFQVCVRACMCVCVCVLDCDHSFCDD